MESNDAKNSSLTPPRWVLLWTGLAVLLVFVYLIRSVLPPFLVGAAAAYIFSPVVDSLQHRRRLPRWAALLILYVALLGPFVIVAIFFGPRFIEETRLLVIRGPFIVTRLIEQIFGPGPYSGFGAAADSQQLANEIIAAIRASFGTPSNALHLVRGIAELGLSAFLSLIVSIYLLADSGNVEDALLRFVPRERRNEVRNVSFEIHQTLGRFLRRQLVLVALVAVATFLGLEFIFHLRYALPLAVATGLVEIIPFIGPVLAGSVAAIIAISQGGTSLMLGVIVFYFVVRQIEDQIVAPVVLGRAVELHPLIVIFSVLAGGVLFGVLGTLAAVPFAASIKVILEYWPKLTAPPPRVEGSPADQPEAS